MMKGCDGFLLVSLCVGECEIIDDDVVSLWSYGNRIHDGRRDEKVVLWSRGINQLSKDSQYEANTNSNKEQSPQHLTSPSQPSLEPSCCTSATAHWLIKHNEKVHVAVYFIVNTEGAKLCNSHPFPHVRQLEPFFQKPNISIALKHRKQCNKIDGILFTFYQIHSVVHILSVHNPLSNFYAPIFYFQKNNRKRQRNLWLFGESTVRLGSSHRMARGNIVRLCLPFFYFNPNCNSH